MGYVTGGSTWTAPWLRVSTHSMTRLLLRPPLLQEEVVVEVVEDGPLQGEVVEEEGEVDLAQAMELLLDIYLVKRDLLIFITKVAISEFDLISVVCSCLKVCCYVTYFNKRCYE